MQGSVDEMRNSTGVAKRDNRQLTSDKNVLRVQVSGDVVASWQYPKALYKKLQRRYDSTLLYPMGKVESFLFWAACLQRGIK